MPVIVTFMASPVEASLWLLPASLAALAVCLLWRIGSGTAYRRPGDAVRTAASASHGRSGGKPEGTTPKG